MLVCLTITRAARAVVCGEGEQRRFLLLHPAHNVRMQSATLLGFRPGRMFSNCYGDLIQQLFPENLSQ